MIKRCIAAAKARLVGKKNNYFEVGTEETKDYWTDHNVTMHHGFRCEQDSLEYFHWRNDQYFNYIELMPVSGQDNKAVLDFGCGPGHDLVGFGVYSRPKKLVGIDLSPSSLAEAASRLFLHGINAELIQLSPDAAKLPFESAIFDHIHCSGVLHHTPDPAGILRELRRVLQPSGTMNVMVYNYDSLWLHLFVAYQRAIVQGLYSELDIREQFQHSTDGENCPISNCYRPNEWVALCKSAGLNAEFWGAAISMHEMAMLPLRFAAIQDRCLPIESRDFLLSLKFDERGYPKYNGHYAGVDACYRVTRVN